MKVIYGLKKIRKFKKPVVALGVFDGVHRGHRIILKSAVKKARSIRGTSVVLTFSPHPQKEESLYSLEHRLRLIGELGIDVSIVINFNQKFAGISAENFIKNILVRKVGADYIYIGKNFHFGKNAEGDFRLLSRLSQICNFKLKIYDVIKINKQSVSSTYIRALIKKAKLDTAQELLGRAVSILGTVIKGASLARKLGFPTANINPHHEVVPPPGVYVVKIIFNHQKLNGVCNIGTKPTFKTQYAIHNTQDKKHIEAYIFNFKQNIYGRDLEIQFIKKIRDEKKFDSLQHLANQIRKDVLATEKFLSSP
jgi:riboflavin kinase/FMN adenylyltransferase